MNWLHCLALALVFFAAVFSTRMKWQKWLEIIIVSLLLVAVGSLVNREAEGPPAAPVQTSEPATDRAAWDALNADQMSWVIEGIQERMSELSDDLHYAQHLQAEKLNAE